MSITPESASPTARRRGGLGAASALDRAAAVLAQRLGQLEERLEMGDDGAWSAYCEAIEALAAVADRTAPGSQGELLTTEQMASRLNLSPKTLLRRKARGEIRPALQKGKLIRWRGDEVPR